MTARLTDDAGLDWQIDHDLHLAKLDSRDWLPGRATDSPSRAAWRGRQAGTLWCRGA